MIYTNVEAMCHSWLNADVILMPMGYLMVIQEWDRCKYLARVRQLTQRGRAYGPDVRTFIPRCLARLIPGMKESMALNEMARYVVEDMKEDLFQELMGYMPECRQEKSTRQQLEASLPGFSDRPREPPVPNSIIPYSFIHLQARQVRTVPSLAPQRSGPSISSKEYRALIQTPELDQRPKVVTVRKAPSHRADNIPPQYSRIRFEKEDTIAIYGPWLAHSGRRGCCGVGRHTCHDSDTWLSRNELRAIGRERSKELELYGLDWGDDIED